MSVASGLVMKVKADGLIIASAPVDGIQSRRRRPIIHPRAEAIGPTPIAPHTLTNRPITCRVARSSNSGHRCRARWTTIFATYDGQSGIRYSRATSYACAGRSGRSNW